MHTASLARVNWKYVHYSASTVVTVTALSYMLSKEGGERVLWPGLFAELIIKGLMLFAVQSDDFYTLPSGAYLVLNTVFYALVVIGMLYVITLLRSPQQRPRA